MLLEIFTSVVSFGSLTLTFLIGSWFLFYNYSLESANCCCSKVQIETHIQQLLLASLTHNDDFDFNH